MSKNKGKAGERGGADLLRNLTGCDVRRGVRQHAADSDLLGLPGWAVEVKRHARVTRGDIAAWWRQAVAQAGDEDRPLLLYRADRAEWRAVWPLSLVAGVPSDGVAWTADTTPEAWAAAAGYIVAAGYG